jgi:Zn-finger nucleic acid-binding protein
MLCPKCGSTMAEQEMQGVPFDRCNECHGLWFDYKALDHVLDKSTSGRSLGGTEEFLSTVGATATDYRCPRCKLHTLLSRSHDGIELDWCETCHGLFLDHDEIQALIAWRGSRVSEDRKEFAKEFAKESAGSTVLGLLAELLTGGIGSLGD